MIKGSIPRGCIDIVQDMYKGAVMSVRATCGETGEFPMTIGFYRRTTLSLYLFALIMDESTTHIQEDVPWCMVFVTDIVLVDRSRNGANAKLERPREALEPK